MVSAFPPQSPGTWHNPGVALLEEAEPLQQPGLSALQKFLQAVPAAPLSWHGGDVRHLISSPVALRNSKAAVYPPLILYRCFQRPENVYTKANETFWYVKNAPENIIISSKNSAM